MWALRDSPDAEVEPTRRMVFLSVLYEQMIDRSVPSAEVVKAIRSLVNSVLGHFGPLKKDRSNRGPK